MSDNKGFLLVTMEPPPALEEEFHDWYRTEHIPERLAVPGFESAQRYVCLSGWPRYLAFYDLKNSSVIESNEYLAISGAQFSPWTQRILARVQGFYRAFGLQVYPGSELTQRAARLTVARLTEVAAPHVESILQRISNPREDFPGLVQARCFRGAGERAGDLLLLAASDIRFDGTSWLRAVVDDAAGRVDLCNEYAHYMD